MLASKTQRSPPRLSGYTQTRDHEGNLTPIDPHTFFLLTLTKLLSMKLRQTLRQSPLPKRRRLHCNHVSIFATSPTWLITLRNMSLQSCRVKRLACRYNTYTTPIIPISVCHYLELCSAIASYTRVHFSFFIETNGQKPTPRVHFLLTTIITLCNSK